MSPSYESFSDLSLQNLGPGGKAPKSRLSDVTAATSLFNNLRTADENSSLSRARIQSMFDGAPPYDERKKREAGQAYQCNLNFGMAKRMLDQSMAAYIDMAASVERLVRVGVTMGEQEQRIEWAGIIEEEITRVIREWPRFSMAYLMVCQKFIAHGVGIIHWPDKLDWRWDASGFGDVLIPRETRASEDEIEVAVIRQPMLINKLYEKIADENTARQLGWNPEEVRKAIAKAASISTTDHYDWEKLVERIKNNDVEFSGSASQKVRMIKLLVQEFDGTVSQYFSLEDGSNADFLYKAPSRYRNMQEAFAFFTYGIGTNGTYHSIRGLGHAVFAQVGWANRLRCAMVDSAMLSSGPLLQPQDEAAHEAFAFNYNGPFGILSPGLVPVERAYPNLLQTAVPVLEDLVTQMNDMAGQYSANALFGGNGSRTRTETLATLEMSNRLSLTSLNLFYEPWTRVMRETVRRLTNPEYSAPLPGGEAADMLRIRCLMRGVPPEALATLDHSRTVCVRAVGAGSQGQRTAALQQLSGYAGNFDPEGRRRLTRDLVATLVGYDNADRFMPPSSGARQPIDAQIAQIENGSLENGEPIEVFESQFHEAHLDRHIPHMQQRLTQLDAGEITLEDATRKILPIHAHSMQHLEMIQVDPTTEMVTAKYAKQLKIFGEVINNGLKHIEARQKQQAAQAEQEGQQEPQQQGISPEASSKFQEHQLKLKMLEETHQMKLALKMQEAELDRTLADAKAAASLRR
jgi:hypothetical protein